MGFLGHRAPEKFMETCKDLLHLLQKSTESLAEIPGELLMSGIFPEFATVLSLAHSQHMRPRL